MSEKTLVERLRYLAEHLEWGNDSESTQVLLDEAADALDSGWLIERYWNGTLLYWTGQPAKTSYGPDIKTGWTTKAYEAMRYSREEDAHTMLSWMLDNEGRVACHMFGLTIPRDAEPGCGIQNAASGVNE